MPLEGFVPVISKSLVLFVSNFFIFSKAVLIKSEFSGHMAWSDEGYLFSMRFKSILILASFFSASVRTVCT